MAEPMVTAQTEQALATPVTTVTPLAPAAASPGKDTKRLTIDLDDNLNYKFSQYALDQGKKKTEIIREWIMSVVAGR